MRMFIRFTDTENKTDTTEQITAERFVKHLPGGSCDVDLRLTESEFSTGSLFKGACTFHFGPGVGFTGKVAFGLMIDGWSRDDYLLMPAAAYDGNRFFVLHKEYPPMFSQDELPGRDGPIFITDVPHLEKDGSLSDIHLLSGDMATPCIGIFQRKAERGVLLYGRHIVDGLYTGFRFAEDGDRAVMEFETPGVREYEYHMCHSQYPSADKGARYAEGDKIELEFIAVRFPCRDVGGLFEMFWNTRGMLEKPGLFIHRLPFSAAYKIIEEKYDKTQWNEEARHWRISPYDSRFSDWQAGWVGGGISSYSLMMDGHSESARRSDLTMDTIFTDLQTSGGYICPIKYNGKWLGDDFNNQENASFLLLRKNADVLYFASKYISNRCTDTSTWKAGLERLADAFVRLFQKYGQIGQFIDTSNDEILAGGTASAAIAAGGLALAYGIFDNPVYLETAEKLADGYIVSYLDKGLFCGGPGEILQNPDSESAFGLLESLVTLYETSGRRKWLDAAVKCGMQCASWCMSYDFIMPENSEFKKRDIKTTGSIFANVQNKHSAPGICTLSPLALLKLYLYTGDDKWLELSRAIAHNITQYLSTSENPIYAKMSDMPLPPGWMCERVNTSDWEGKGNIGEVYCGSDWCEVSCLLTYNEMPGILIETGNGKATAFDHVDIINRGKHEGQWRFELINPTEYAACVKVGMVRSCPIGAPSSTGLIRETVIVPPGESVVVMAGMGE